MACGVGSDAGKTERGVGALGRLRVDVGPKMVARDTGGAFNVNDALCRYPATLPLAYGWRLDAKLDGQRRLREASIDAVAGKRTFHIGHLSISER